MQDLEGPSIRGSPLRRPPKYQRMGQYTEALSPQGGNAILRLIFLKSQLNFRVSGANSMKLPF